MSLPILPSHRNVSEADLIRLFHRTELQWCQMIAEETQLDVGTALTNPQLNGMWDANQVFDAALPEGVSPGDALAEVQAHFVTHQTQCLRWVMNPSAAASQTEPLIQHLLAGGFIRRSHDILYLAGPPTRPIQEVGGLTIIPARASYKHARELASQWLGPQGADAEILRFEDPQTDALIALKDGVAAGFVAVISVGELGQITDLFVAEAFRNQGIGRTLMSRAMEICARSLFKHVFIGVDPNETHVVEMYKRFGFRRLFEFVHYTRP